MKITLLSIVMLACAGAQNSVIRRTIWYHYNATTWEHARAVCQYYGMELLTIVTQSEIDNTNMDEYYAWIGLKEYRLGWYWFDGSIPRSGYGDFEQHEPHRDDDCALTRQTANKAIGDRCGHTHFYFCHYFENGERKFSFHTESKSWQQASQDCKDSNQQLVYFKNWSNRPSKVKQDFPVWIGLYHDGESWRWSDEEPSDFRNWAAGSDPDLSPGRCGTVSSQNKSMSAHSCSKAFPYLCYSHNLVLVQQNLTWEEALEQCRSLETVHPFIPHRLLSVELSDLVYANSKAMYAQTDKVWLGLRFLGESWFWSNGRIVTLSGLPSCPEPELSCGALVLDRTSNASEPQPSIELCDCSERFNLLCYKLY